MSTHTHFLGGPRASPGAGGRPRMRGTSGATDSLFAKVHVLASFYVLGVCSSFFLIFSSFFIIFTFLSIVVRFFYFCLAFFKVSGHVEVGSSSKEPAFDLFARVGRRGLRDRLFYCFLGPERCPPSMLPKSHDLHKELCWEILRNSEGHSFGVWGRFLREILTSNNY